MLCIAVVFGWAGAVTFAATICLWPRLHVVLCCAVLSLLFLLALSRSFVETKLSFVTYHTHSLRMFLQYFPFLFTIEYYCC